ncbi:hypothetical protein FRB96_005391 [Tulasnella sp. 330]|nr:hypothetical protein FRB96_005391 [Tulasnella sp. 330]KAG8883017.1 hypothetical protein FRB97_007391 [Tulasnella sp. 331]KAG8888512.1 hypothetical protein FRB98_007553 [Tulasnella sp. 332]
MRSTFLVTLFTLFLASLSFARIHTVTAPATVKEGSHFDVTFHTESYIEQNRDYAVTLGFSTTSCFTCVGTPAGSFDLVAQGEDDTGHGTFTEKIRAPTTEGSYEITVNIVSAVADLQHAGLRFFSIPLTVTH